MINRLTRDIWNNFIAVPKNKKGEFQLSPSELKRIIIKSLENETI